MKLSNKNVVLGFCFCVLFSSSLAYSGEFVVKHIKVVGLQRISLSTVSNYLPVHVGQRFNTKQTVRVIRALYDTGFFQAVSLDRQGDTLVVKVVERGTIGNVNLIGNKDIPSKRLREVLKQLGLVKGHVFQRSALERLRLQLKQEYNNRGKYNARITTSTTPLTQNRIGITIRISEGRVARIKDIRIIGNHKISDDTLKSLMLLRSKGLFTYFTKKDQYSVEALDRSLEAIRTYYLDHGFLRIKIDSSQVLLAPDKKDVYINIRLTEGPKYTFAGFRIFGKTILSKEKLSSYVKFEKGQEFSRTKVTDTIKAIGEAYGDIGFGFPAINAEPKLDERKRTVFVNFIIKPGRHVYVRQINFTGNTKTAGYVLRNVIKQDEGSLLSLKNIRESERQLKILGYLKNVKVQTVPVAGANNQVDLIFHVEEAPSAEASVSLGYGTNGPEFNAAFNQHNFMGTGKTIGLNFNASYWGRSYSFNYYNPFYTAYGVGRGFNVYYQTVDPKRLDISIYTSDKYGFAINYNVLLGDKSSVQFGYGLERLKITSLGATPATQIQNFVNANGRVFNQLRLTGGWNHNTYDQQPFPNRGINQQANLLVSLPIDRHLKYYKANYSIHGYLPVGQTGFILTALANVGYGNTFNKRGLPFFENFFAGGIAQPGQVRGYESYSLGPVDSQGNNLGGNILVSGMGGVILPYPFSRETIRTTAFLDFGNVYTRGLPANQRGTLSGRIRMAAGVSLDWRSPFGPLSFSLAKPVNKRPGDVSEMFQFTLTSGF